MASSTENSTFPEFQNRRGTVIDAAAGWPLKTEPGSNSRPLHNESQGLNTRQAPEPSTRKGWLPFWLSPWFLCLMALSCSLCAAALVALYSVAKAQHGLRIIHSNHYYWTFAPTAIAIFMVALWRQIDYHCKSLAPWSVLSRQGSASETVLADYISPLQIISLRQAIKNREYGVSFSICGFAGLKQVALFSTGLLLLAPTDIKAANVQLLNTASFNGSLVNVATAISLPSLNDSSLVYNAYGINAQNLTPPDGLYQGFVFEPFRLDASAFAYDDFKNVTAEVTIVTPEYHCESAPVNILLQPANTTDERPADTIQIAFPECSMPDNGTGTRILALNPQNTIVPARQLSGVVQRIQCQPNLTDNWQMITLVDFRYNQTFNETSRDTASNGPLQALSWSTEVANVASIACRSSYTVKKANVTCDMLSTPPRAGAVGPLTHLSSQLVGFSHADLGRLVTASLTAASDMFGSIQELAYATEYPNTLLKFMAALDSADYEALLDENVMSPAAEKALNAIASQNFRKYLMQQASSPIQGSGLVQVQRLHINDISVWLMFAGFISAAVAGSALICLRPRAVVPRDPGSLATIGLVLGQQNQDQDVFQRGCGGDLFPLEESLKQNDFYTVSQASSFLIKTRPHDYAPQPGSKNDSPRWWTPIFIKRYVYILCLVLPIITIAVLEVLQQLSARNHGIGTVDSADSLDTKILTRYLPALVIFLIATLINSIEFNITLLAPYQAMSRGWTSARQSILDPALGKFPIFALLTLARQQNWGPLLAACSALLASILGIIVASLYVVEDVSSIQGTTLSAVDSLGTSWPDSVIGDNGAAVLMSLTESANLSYAAFTYEELAFDQLVAADPTSLAKASPNATLTAMVNAHRADLNCTALSKSQFNVSISNSFSFLGGSVTVDAFFPLPKECPFGGPDGNATELDFQQTFQLSPSTNTSVVGKITDLHVGPFNDITMLSSDELDPTAQNSNPPGCPSLGFIYGYVDINSDADTSIAVLVCYQQTDSIPTNTTFNAVDLSINQQNPPIPDESQRITLPADANGAISFAYRPQLHFDSSLAIFNQTTFDSSSGNTEAPVDNFFQAVLFGKYPIPQSYFGDPSKQSQVYSAILGVYRRYMAQAISANMRAPFTASGASSAAKRSQPAISATLYDPNSTLRVVQNETSKIILQALLGATVVFMVVAVKLTRMNEVLQHNPCTIAGTATLWAASRYCRNRDEQIPVGAVWMSDKQLDEEVFAGWRFRLGWWDDLRGGRRWGIEAIRKARDD